MTAQFAELSKQVNTIESQLRTQHRDDVADRLRHVQEMERDKLMLTSALGVEKMRLEDMQRRDEAEQDLQVTSLLESSIESLTKQHTDVIVRINEELDEIRIALIDEDEDE